MLTQRVCYIHSSHPSLMSLGALRASSLQEPKPGAELTRQAPESMATPGCGWAERAAHNCRSPGDRGSEMGTRRGVKNFSCTCYLSAPFHNWQACVYARGKGGKSCVQNPLKPYADRARDEDMPSPEETTS